MIETPTRIEPCFFDGGMPPDLSKLAKELEREAATLGRGLSPEPTVEFSDLIRIADCHYSNLIEGRHARPEDIEKALAGGEVEPERRSLALEAKANVMAQRRIDEMRFRRDLPSPTSVEFLTWAHGKLHEETPADFRLLKRTDGSEVEIVPGEFRKAESEDVVVGRHQPPSSKRVEAFMAHFSKRFGAAEKRASTRVVALASAHHRFNYIHPFPDGNGRTSRLMSRAMAVNAGVGGNGLWSISRGLARGLRDPGEYKRMMDVADSPRRGDLDGRGNLSEAALREFCEWFLAVALDQVRFSSEIFAIDRLEDRYRSLIKDVSDDRRAPDLVAAVLRHGSLRRADIEQALGTSGRAARATASDLIERGLLKSGCPQSPVQLTFPISHHARLFPNLFAEDVSRQALKLAPAS